MTIQFLSLEEISAGGIFTDGDWVESKDQDPSGSVRLTQLADVGIGAFLDRSSRYLRPDQAKALNCTYLQPDDILIARMPDPLGRACLIPENIGDAVTVVDVAILRVNQKIILPRYAMWMINSPQFSQEVASKQSGTTRKRISRKNLAKLAIPVPPLNEQRKIVEIIEDLFAQINQANRGLDSSRKKALALGSHVVTEHLGGTACAEMKLPDLISAPIRNGRSVPTRDGGFPVLRLTALRHQVVDLREHKQGAWEISAAQDYIIKDGDFLISRGNGSLKLVGRGSIVNEPFMEVAYPDTMFRIRPNKDVIHPHFLALTWNSSIVRRQIEKRARTTAGIYKINQSDLRSVILPVPNMDDQYRITDRVVAAQETLDRCVKATNAILIRSQALWSSILSAAFGGAPSKRITTRRLYP